MRLALKPFPLCINFQDCTRHPHGLFAPATNQSSRVILKVLKTCRKAELQAHVRNHVAEGSTVLTDALKSYNGLNDKYAHEVIDHAVSYAKWPNEKAEAPATKDHK